MLVQSMKALAWPSLCTRGAACSHKAHRPWCVQHLALGVRTYRVAPVCVLWSGVIHDTLSSRQEQPHQQDEAGGVWVAVTEPTGSRDPSGTEIVSLANGHGREGEIRE
jgi:hypothetical protein